MTGNPKCILLFSGKRKSGKDYLTEELLKRLKPHFDCVVIKISAPIKARFAGTYNLPLSDLMGDGQLKERYRAEMIRWSDVERAKDPGIFCRGAVTMYEGSKHAVWVVSDVRRKTDIAWFQTMYGDTVQTVRINADEDTRQGRGYVFTEGVDNVQSECDLDDIHQWTWIIDNSSHSDPFPAILNIEQHVRNICS